LKKALIAIGVIVVIAVFVLLNLKKEGTKVEVSVTEVQRREITKFVTGSGQIQPKRKVDVSASAIGKVTRLAVKEGDRVKRGDFLLQIDPTDYQSAVDQLSASIRAAMANLDMEKANLRKAESDYERIEGLYSQKLVSEEDMRTVDVNRDVVRARVRGAEETLEQHKANLNKAAHDLSEVRITADIDGVITTLNVEEGENAIMGTLNNPGTVLLTIADLSEMEAEVEVDETEVVFVHVGQEAIINIDAYPDSSFKGIVTEVGNSAIRQQIGMGQSSVDFKVVVAVKDIIANVRPGLSASAKVRVAREVDALSIPIQCLTVRQKSDLEGTEVDSTDAGEGESEDDSDVEGVFVVENGIARYRPVQVGIAGNSYFHVTEGLSEAEVIITGPFKAINELKNGDPVKVEKNTDSS
jgi:HlyD family secretion protein